MGSAGIVAGFDIRNERSCHDGAMHAGPRLGRDEFVAVLDEQMERFRESARSAVVCAPVGWAGSGELSSWVFDPAGPHVLVFRSHPEPIGTPPGAGSVVGTVRGHSSATSFGRISVPKG